MTELRAKDGIYKKNHSDVLIEKNEENSAPGYLSTSCVNSSTTKNDGMQHRPYLCKSVIIP